MMQLRLIPKLLTLCSLYNFVLNCMHNLHMLENNRICKLFELKKTLASDMSSPFYVTGEQVLSASS